MTDVIGTAVLTEDEYGCEIVNFELSTSFMEKSLPERIGSLYLLIDTLYNLMDNDPEESEDDEEEDEDEDEDDSEWSDEELA
jgi:hypothetical protein